MTDVRAVLALTETLAAINRWFPATAQPPRTVVSQTRITHVSKPPLPADVLSIRRDTIDKLADWCWTVIDKKDLHPTLDLLDVSAMTSFLGIHAEFLADDAGRHVQRELDHLATALEQIVKQSRPRRVTVGPCPECDEEGHDCTGMMTATVRRSDDLLPSTVRCGVDRHHVWEPHDWPALGRRMVAKAAG